MEVKEAKDRAKKLKKEIGALVMNFEKVTGTTVTDITLTHFASLRRDPEISYVEIEVKL